MILFDETIRQNALDGTSFPKLLESKGVIPGIKVDQGAKPLALAEGETITEGLDGLRERVPAAHLITGGGTCPALLVHGHVDRLGPAGAQWLKLVRNGDDLCLAQPGVADAGAGSGPAAVCGGAANCRDAASCCASCGKALGADPSDPGHAEGPGTGLRRQPLREPSPSAPE